jgi:hypothetical protein
MVEGTSSCGTRPEGGLRDEAASPPQRFCAAKTQDRKTEDQSSVRQRPADQAMGATHTNRNPTSSRLPGEESWREVQRAW